jgi:hypothetical protein
MTCTQHAEPQSMLTMSTLSIHHTWSQMPTLKRKHSADTLPSPTSPASAKRLRYEALEQGLAHLSLHTPQSRVYASLPYPADPLSSETNVRPSSQCGPDASSTTLSPSLSILPPALVDSPVNHDLSLSGPKELDVDMEHSTWYELEKDRKLSFQIAAHSVL